MSVTIPLHAGSDSWRVATKDCNYDVICHKAGRYLGLPKNPQFGDTASIIVSVESFPGARKVELCHDFITRIYKERAIRVTFKGKQKYFGYTSYLLTSVRALLDKAGMRGAMALYVKGGPDKLTNKSFTEIADWIEVNL